MFGATDMSAILSVENLQQNLFDPDRGDRFTVTVDKPIKLMAGDFAALLGPSGCGKTTLLSVLGLLRKPSKPSEIKSFKFGINPDQDGNVSEVVDVSKAWSANDRGLIEHLRRKHVGFSLQSGELLSSLTVAENIRLPLELNGFSDKEAAARVTELIDAFGLSRQREGGDGEISLAKSRINKLSGGEYQRVVLARAVAHKPDLVFVDEPTAALNHELARRSLSKLVEMQQKEKCAILMITHDEHLAKEFANVVIRMEPVSGKPAGHIASIETRELVRNLENEAAPLESESSSKTTDGESIDE
jgi:putative ABC transport system ATP-binding protein